MKKIIMLSAAFGLAVLPFSASAEDLSFELINNSSSDITEFHVSDPSDDTWSDNLMPSVYVLPAGYTVDVNITDGEDHCEYDIRATFEDGSEYEEYGVDVCDLGEWTFTD